MPEAYRQIAHHLHLLVHIRLIDDTWKGGLRRREVSEIRELTGALEAGQPVTHLVYRRDESGNEEFHLAPASTGIAHDWVQR